MTDVIGIIGVGHFAGYLIEGFYNANPSLKVLLSPRSKSQSAYFAQKYRHIIAKDNQDVVDRSNIIIISVKPNDVSNVTQNISFKSSHLVISVASGVKYDTLVRLVHPATVVCALPLSSAAINQSPTLVFPAHDKAYSYLELLGPVIIMPDEAQFTVAITYGAFYGWSFKLMQEMMSWGTKHGLAEDTSRILLENIFKGMAGMSGKEPDKEIENIVDSLATKGGVTELGLDVFEQNSGFDVWHEALDAVYKRQSKKDL
jgi:pyrroline-5-carboxylate reductase